MQCLKTSSNLHFPVTSNSGFKSTAASFMKLEKTKDLIVERAARDTLARLQQFESVLESLRFTMILRHAELQLAQLPQHPSNSLTPTQTSLVSDEAGFF